MDEAPGCGKYKLTCYKLTCGPGGPVSPVSPGCGGGVVVVCLLSKMLAFSLQSTSTDLVAV